jgi:glycerol kinase
MERSLLSLDQGTTNTKALLVGRDGRPVFRTSAGLTLSHPRAGYAEQDPLAIWASVLRVIESCVAQGIPIAGVAISNQRETALAWERSTGQPLAPAMSWQCRRSAALCERLAGRAGRLRERSGLPLDPLLSATKWAWLMENDAALAARARAGEICFGTVDSWLIWQLTGGAVHACDHTNASRTGLLNLAAAAWDEELAGLFGIPLAALPEVKTSSCEYGRCVGVDGLDGVPIVAAIGDSHAALLGHGSCETGTVKATYGTGSSLMTLAAALPDARTLASTIAWSLPGCVRYALEGNISMAGAAVKWVADLLGLSLDEAVALAATVNDSGGVTFVPAMLGLGAPYWRADARGLICGLEAGSRAAHLAKAAVDAIALQVRDVFDAMEALLGVALPALHADGGATRNDELMQLQADLLGRPVLRSACEDLSALGAAWLGGLTLGWWRTTAEFAGLSDEPAVFEPRMFPAQREAMIERWHAAVGRTLAEAR